MATKAINVDELIGEQENLFDQIKGAEKNHKKCAIANRTKGYLLGRIRSTEELWKRFSENHIKITIAASSKDRESEYFKKQLFDNAEEFFSTFLGDIYETLEKFKTSIPLSESADISFNHSSCDATRKSTNLVKLPRVEIPRFSGEYCDWPSFHDLYISLIHNNAQLSDVQKLYFLKSALSGNAERLIRHLDVVEKNYQSAWELLTKRYDNKRIIVNNILHSFTSQAVIKSESPEAVRGLLDRTNECLHSLRNLDLDVDTWDAIIIFLLLQKLPAETKELWEDSLVDKDSLPKLSDMTNFLEARFRTLEMLRASRDHSFTGDTKERLRKNTRTFHLNHSQESCILCKGEHHIRKCSQFLEMSITNRKDLAKQRSLCFNCLAANHSSRKCNSLYRCYYCSQRHHTLLHESASPTYTMHRETKIQSDSSHNTQPTRSTPETTLGPTPTQSRLTSLFLKNTDDSTYGLLSTALVRVDSSTGTQTLRVLVDPGSQGSFITEHAVQMLRLQKDKASICITGIKTLPASVAKHQVKVIIRSMHDKEFVHPVKAFVLKSLTNVLPSQKIVNHKKWHHLRNLVLSDPLYHTPGKVDMLFGVDAYQRIVRKGLIEGEENSPSAQNTSLGWILFGEVQDSPTYDKSDVQILNFHNCIEDEQLLKRFWEIEELQQQKVQTDEERQCEEHFRHTHERLSNGRYRVQLPFVDSKPPALGRSYDTALSRYHQLERKLLRAPDLKQQYADCINEYLHLGHMSRVVDREENHAELTQDGTKLYNVNYLPHHCVIKESTTTRLRVVFDASSRTSNGVLLNDCLLVGPKLQENIFSIVLRWRKHRVAFTADITKMYRQIHIAEKCSPYQRILWRNHPGEPIAEFELNTVTFGTSSAPYLAVRVLHQLSDDEKPNYPLAYNILKTDFYVDDVMTGADTVEITQLIQGQLEKMLAAGGFELRKYASNSSELLQTIPIEKQEVQAPLNVDRDDTLKTLGLFWHPVKDVFKFKVSLNPNQVTSTKRNLLSQISRLFDPIGWISPTIVLAKIIIQKLWIAGIQWDDPVPEHIAREWESLKKQLPLLENVQIPRWVYTIQGSDIQLHGFADASTVAYCAVVYLRVFTKEGGTRVSLLTAKSKVAPVKPITLPRLELCAAVLLSQLIHNTVSSLQIDNPTIFAWTDSTITLSWIHGKPNQWKTFVCNRVAEIHKYVEPSRWRHVRSAENPADCGSRGVSPSELVSRQLWWYGPAWLTQDIQSWPQKIDILLDVPDTKIVKTYMATVQESTIQELLNDYSSWLKTLRITALCFRFAENCKRLRAERQVNFLTTNEIQRAETLLIKTCQRNDFGDDIHRLQHSQPLSHNSKILSLNPFLDDVGLLRVGGRLANAVSLSFTEKHPIILSNKNRLTQLISIQAHFATLHGGPSLMLAFLRRRFWIIQPRNLLRRIVHECIICFRHKGKTMSQIMGNLPEPRVEISRPFTHTGVDYAGPLSVRMSPHMRNKSYKGYVAIFICLCTKAIHLEAVSDLTTAAFLAALKRFIARRGLCAHIYSDCGRNFGGADSKLQQMFNQAIKNHSDIAAAQIANQGITWHFIPPASPHFGGLWEAGVKSMKHHLRRIVGDTILTFEELSTLLSQIESCLNSRPLVPMSDDCMEVLTPGHFLIGNSLLAPPENNITEEKIHLRSRWELIKKLHQQFWKAWSSEFLSRLQSRPKWRCPSKNITNNDMVLIKEDGLPPNQWLLGRVVQTFPGKDEIIRVASVKTKTGILKRPISKLCLLPISDNHNKQSYDAANSI